jgi:hypothetical protein
MSLSATQALASAAEVVSVVERDGFGVALSQMGAMVRTATGFASKRSAQDWIAQDTQLHNADNPFRERD